MPLPKRFADQTLDHGHALGTQSGVDRVDVLDLEIEDDTVRNASCGRRYRFMISLQNRKVY